MTYRIGLLSDTHMPARWNEIPGTLAGIFEGVDLMLHAGDVGKLWVLDELSKIGPVVAVHGNDETAEATEHLPLTQIVTVGGIRILVWHSHFVDQVDEMEARRIPEMRPKLERIARYGRRVGAGIVHFGHWHIPLDCEIEGVRLVNAGGIASGNFGTRQAIQTVATLEIGADGGVEIQHYDLKDGRPFYPADVVEMDFRTAELPYSASILDGALEAVFPVIRKNRLLAQVLYDLSPRCWWGGQDVLRMADMAAVLEGMEKTAEVAEAVRLLNNEL
jgi:putative phosphoesterase